LLSVVEVNLRVEYTPVGGVEHKLEPKHMFLLESTVVGFVTMIWKSSLSTTKPDVLAAASAFDREN